MKGFLPVNEGQSREISAAASRAAGFNERNTAPLLAGDGSGL